MKKLSAKGIYFLGLLTILFSFFFLVWVTVSLAWPFVVIDVDTKSSFIPQKEKYEPGEELVVSLVGCKKINAPKTVTVRIVGETIISLPPYVSCAAEKRELEQKLKDAASYDA